jgi:hypothetical protein
MPSEPRPTSTAPTGTEVVHVLAILAAAAIFYAIGTGL